MALARLPLKMANTMIASVRPILIMLFLIMVIELTHVSYIFHSRVDVLSFSCRYQHVVCQLVTLELQIHVNAFSWSSATID
jgi:hypothetical protein